MDRREQLKSLIDARFGGVQADFARAIKRSPAQVNQWLSGHRLLGDAGARHIEITLGLPIGFFDGGDAPSTIVPEASAAVHHPDTEPGPQAAEILSPADAKFLGQITQGMQERDIPEHVRLSILTLIASSPEKKS